MGDEKIDDLSTVQGLPSRCYRSYTPVGMGPVSRISGDFQPREWCRQPDVSRSLRCDKDIVGSDPDSGRRTNINYKIQLGDSY